jgi:DNA-binding NtrC family response regulator
MKPSETIQGKRVLIVDDEQDVLDTLTELLDVCKIDTAVSFEAARELLQHNFYDIVILDIMGVGGFDLLDIATERGIPALMLTAHAFSEETLKKSAEKKACCFVPKEKMSDIQVFVADVIEALENGKNPWIKCFERLGRFYDKKFNGKN